MAINRSQTDEIDIIQMNQQERFRSFPKSGTRVGYLGKEFIVLRNVFWLPESSMPLVQNFRINKGETVLDVCTGSGVIAVFAAYKGASHVVAVDINPDSVKCARANARLHDFERKIDVRLSDMFDAVKKDEKFDVITANLPFRNKAASDFVEASQWDTGLRAHRRFFRGAGKHLRPGGRIYLMQSNFGAVEEMKKLAESSGFSVKLIGKKKMQKDSRIFYAFELKKHHG